MFFFNYTGGFQWKSGGIVTTFDDRITNLYRDTENDTLYVLIDDVIYTWQTGAYRQGTWASKDLYYPRPVTWADAQVIAEDYTDCTLNFYANGDIVTPEVSYALIQEQAFKVPMMKRERRWRFELVTSTPIDEWQIGTNASELRS